MTIIYQYRVATTTLGGFLKLLAAWKGSVYKLLYKELIIFVCLYAIISLIYRLALDPEQKRMFEAIVVELNGVSSAIPLSFVLGFYVTFIVQRWWQQFTNVPWPDRTLFIMTTYLHGFDDKARMMRRAVARYMLFGLIFICRAVSVAVMKRFPTVDHIVDAGFITKEEAAIFESTQCKYQKFFVPLMWANQILVTARREGKIESDFGLRMIIQSLADFRDKCSLCFVYDWITVPLVYTQVVTFAVYSFFAVSLFAEQYLDPAQKYKGYETDFYVPGFTILQFLFYMGWLKVAEQMINPFGEDDDDYDINWLLDRHTAVAFALVDQCYGRHPGLVKDQFWNDVAPDIPYTESSIRSIRPNFLGSTFNIARPSVDHERMVLRDHDDINQGVWPTRPRGKGSMTESLLTLFPFRHLRHGTGDSQITLESNGSGHGRLMSVPNGRAYYHMISKNDEEDRDGGIRRSSIDLPVTPEEEMDPDDVFQLRERASTDADYRSAEDKERKLSLPFSIHLFSKNKQKKHEPQPVTQSPKLSRFSVEPVKDTSFTDSEPGSATKTRRSGNVNVLFQNNDKVSRPPVLSAIEEGNTVTSMKQILMPRLSEDNTIYDTTEEDTLLGDVIVEDAEEKDDDGADGAWDDEGKKNDNTEGRETPETQTPVKSVTFDDMPPSQPLTRDDNNDTTTTAPSTSATPTTTTTPTTAEVTVEAAQTPTSTSTNDVFGNGPTTTTPTTENDAIRNRTMTAAAATTTTTTTTTTPTATGANASGDTASTSAPEESTSTSPTTPKIFVTPPLRTLSSGRPGTSTRGPSNKPTVTPFQEIDTRPGTFNTRNRSH